MWIAELEREDKFSDYAKYEHTLHLHNEKRLNMQRVNSQIIHKAKDLKQVGCISSSTSGVNGVRCFYHGLTML